MAIAFMANAQHLFVRKDILDKVGHDIPKTYEEVLAACKAIRDAGIMQYPFAMLSKPDWNLGEEFVNMYLGHGGEFFKPGTAEPGWAEPESLRGWPPGILSIKFEYLSY